MLKLVRAFIFMEYISLCTYTVMKKNCVFIAATCILSELHALWQPVMQGYVIGLTTLNDLPVWYFSNAFQQH